MCKCDGGRAPLMQLSPSQPCKSLSSSLLLVLRLRDECLAAGRSCILDLHLALNLQASASSFRAVVLIGVAAAFIPHITKPCVTSKLAKVKSAASPPQWLPVLLATNNPAPPPMPPPSPPSPTEETKPSPSPPPPAPPTCVVDDASNQCACEAGFKLKKKWDVKCCADTAGSTCRKSLNNLLVQLYVMHHREEGVGTAVAPAHRVDILVTGLVSCRLEGVGQTVTPNAAAILAPEPLHLLVGRGGHSCFLRRRHGTECSRDAKKEKTFRHLCLYIHLKIVPRN